MTQRIIERLEPDTASKSRSIWDGINRELFERQSQALFQKQHVAGRRCYTGIARTTSAIDTHAIPLDMKGA